jgi:hypothetical protein
VVDGAFPVLIRRVKTNIRGHVGVLAAKTRDSVGFAASDADCRSGVIVGGVHLEDCVAPEESPRPFSAARFGHEIERFYPGHFLP